VREVPTVESLSAQLEALASRTDETLIIEIDDVRHYFIQFAEFGGGSIHSEAVSNEFLEGTARLTEAQEQQLQQFGWERPNDTIRNWFVEVDGRHDPGFAGLASLVVRTIEEVYGGAPTGSAAEVRDEDLALTAITLDALHSLGIRFNAIGSTFTFVFEHEGHETLYTCVAGNWVLTLAAIWILEPDERQVALCQAAAGDMDEMSCVYAVRAYEERPCLCLQAKTIVPDRHRNENDVAAWLWSTVGELLEIHRGLEQERLGS
jgi:hypothetical protein